MVMMNAQLSTGLPGLDRVIRGIIPGDNVVWRVDSIDDYLAFVKPYCSSAIRLERKLVYFRFAKHDPLLTGDSGADIYTIDPQSGFESFITEIHQRIKQAGLGAFFVFDCLSDLAVDWYSDQMLGNFFMLTCPYLYDLETIAYFGLLRNYHSYHAVSAIAETAQVFLDVYRHQGNIYVRPMKVQQRNSPMMFMFHIWENSTFRPVADSSTIAEILNSSPWSGVESASPRMNIWNRIFRQAEDIRQKTAEEKEYSAETQEVFHRLLRMIVSRDERMFRLAKKYFTLKDLLDIGKRMIGTGLVGGKSVGMLLARAILRQASDRWRDLLEVHDSVFIGSDVFYTFLVQNGCWWKRPEKRDIHTMLSVAEIARQRILMGTFPDHIIKQFADMLDYFGQSPIIVRSSSLLEDNFGNSFAGKYESVFCANQGSRHKRLEDFMFAVRTIYASTMSEKAIRYRAGRGLLDSEEQMALLVQRVSGSLYGSLFYPQIAGTGFSFNPYVWSERIDPEAGVLRLVFGLGTRAVDRSDDDYTRVVALNAPERRPEGSPEAARQYAQRKVDVLDLEANQLVSRSFMQVAEHGEGLPIDLFASDRSGPVRADNSGISRNPSDWSLTFEKLLSRSDFPKNMREMLATLREAYDYPVDIEFTANFENEHTYRINLVQCRPFQVKGTGVIVPFPENIDEKNLILETKGPVIGHSRSDTVDRLIYVTPSIYGQMPLNDRYSVARLIGRLTHIEPPNSQRNVMLLGPGRWGTTTPSLGVPVSFAEINTVSFLCEIVAMREDLVPDVSLGTHFFSELIEMNMLYLALYPDQENNYLKRSFFEESPNKLIELLPNVEKWAEVVRVIDMTDAAPGRVLRLNANTLKQEAVCYLERAETF
ncbi:MAG TPA: PEP/pyruvate-binding domain-containing protein [bacterium]|nr:PEP/pyruvate-binding domain-containing protein [bacterium]HQL63480.1 PEP/pyruvate-binding domain-containing protein [bacterium]